MKPLKDYVLKIPSHVGASLADETVKYLEDEATVWREHIFYDNIGNTYLKNGQDCYFSRSVTPNHSAVMHSIWRAIEIYITETHKLEYFNAWKGHTQVEYHRYHPTSKMQKHCDHIHDIFDGQIKGIPILSVLGTLNDGYEGGEFIMFEDEVIELNKGDIVVFPSCFLYPHMVKELLAGVRYSFVSWVY